jgi:hypothetical protein
MLCVLSGSCFTYSYCFAAYLIVPTTTATTLLPPIYLLLHVNFDAVFTLLLTQSHLPLLAKSVQTSGYHTSPSCSEFCGRTSNAMLVPRTSKHQGSGRALSPWCREWPATTMLESTLRLCLQ